MPPDWVAMLRQQAFAVLSIRLPRKPKGDRMSTRLWKERGHPASQADVDNSTAWFRTMLRAD